MSEGPDLDPRLVWDDAGAPRSGRFGDIYFSMEDGLAESRAVFLDGCGLPEAFTGRGRFVVGELGFGSGLNIAALIDLWRRAGPADGRLHVFSVEAFPLSRAEAARALGRWPELGAVTDLMLERWPACAPGFHRMDLPEFRCTVDVALMEVAEALRSWTGGADAWFLDGFAPARNPEMWRDEVLELIAARSAPNARLATFTVAGQVRRGLAAAGFDVDKRPGHGRKRERLEARLHRQAEPAPPASGEVAVIGAGIAGAAVARGLARAGLQARVFEAAGAGSGASGNAVALVTPRLDAGGGAVATFSAQAFVRAVEIYRRETPEAVIAHGVLQLEGQARDAARFDRVADQAFWPKGSVARLGAEPLGRRLGEPVARGALELSHALSVAPEAILDAWLSPSHSVTADVARLERLPGGGWRLLDGAGEALAEVAHVVLCGGAGAHDLLRPLAPRLAGALSPVRGQLTLIQGVGAPAALAWGGYLTPTREGLALGATHNRGVEATEARDEDDVRNLETLAVVLPRFAAALKGERVRGRASIRATTPDRLPLAGPLGDGLHVLTGLGSRGFCTAPILGEHVGALVAGALSPLPLQHAALVSPDRFLNPNREE